LRRADPPVDGALLACEGALLVDKAPPPAVRGYNIHA